MKTLDLHNPESLATAQRLIDKYGEDYKTFFYRPGFDEFIRKEVLPYLATTPAEYLKYLDNNHWNDKNPLNFPGPFYTCYSDTCGTGVVQAPSNVLDDEEHMEFIFRQPSDYREFAGVLDAAAVEVLDSHSSNGNEYWTVQLCREWWQDRAEMIIKQTSQRSVEINGPAPIDRYRFYMNTAAEVDLRKYCYFLDNGHHPMPGQILPEL